MLEVGQCRVLPTQGSQRTEDCIGEGPGSTQNLCQALRGPPHVQEAPVNWINHAIDRTGLVTGATVLQAMEHSRGLSAMRRPAPRMSVLSLSSLCTPSSSLPASSPY